MLQQFLEVNIWVLIVIMARVGTVFSLMPGFSAGYISTRFRLSMALAVTFMLLPVLAAYVPPLPVNAVAMFLILAGEVIIGAFLASIGIFVISALQAAGTFIAYFSSMANALIQDPVANQQSSVISGFLSTAALVAIFAADLHHVALRAVIDSFSLFQPGQPIAFGDMSQTLAITLSDSFALGLKIASPMLLSALVYYISLGILGRLMPTLQVFFFGLPLQISMQLWVLMICFSGMMMVFLQAYSDAYTPFLAP
ncbi:MAG: flagellar biosynthetic protein FliR [Rhodospirillales bacterium]|nr:flagellar biosynthetic protein FliR [Rhodospirillales bacterium]MBO6787408.1 flagellar biosynthetic protein FliR [Rhodospirillales bacterium]